MLSHFIRYAERFPKVIDYRDPSLARIHATPSSYLTFTLTAASLAALLGFFAGAAISVILFCATLAFLILLPRLEEQKRVQEIEAELPFLLQTLALFTKLNVPFTESIKRLRSSTPLGREVGVACASMAQGIPFSRAILERAQAIPSQKVKRAFSQLVSIHRSGGGAYALENLASDLRSAERLSIREHAARSGLLGMVFIIASAVLPTFVLLLAAIGPSAGFGFSPGTAQVILLVGVPVAASALIVVMQQTSPRRVLGNQPDPRGFLVTALAGVAAAALALALPEYLLLGIVLIFACGAYLAYPQYLKDTHEGEVYETLPDALLSASSLAPSARPEEFFETLKQGKALTKEATISQKQLASRIGVGQVLDDWYARIRTPWMERVVLLYKDVFNTNAFSELHAVAQDMLSNREMERETQALLAQQRYTLILGACIVPLILGQVVTLSAELATTFGKPNVTVGESTILAYLIMYALLCAVYLAYLDERASRAALYLAILSVVSLGIFGFF